MNPVLQANINIIMSHMPEVKGPRGYVPKAKLVKDSTSSKIIRYLLDNGATNGPDLRANVGFKGGVSRTIQPHIKTKRILVRKELNTKNCIYEINPIYGESHFIFAEE